MARSAVAAVCLALLVASGLAGISAFKEHDFKARCWIMLDLVDVQAGTCVFCSFECCCAAAAAAFVPPVLAHCCGDHQELSRHR